LTGVLSLVLAAMMLVVVVRLRRVADGSAIVQNISFVVAASLCLVVSIVLGWVGRLVPTAFSADIVRTGGDVLVTVSVLLFAVYFERVRRALASFLDRLCSDDVLAAAQGDPAEGDVA
jgi:hypothetical protein